jgi:hypothetical protein
MLYELLSLEWLAREVAKHVIGGAILDLQVSTIDAVLDVIEPDIDVPCSLTGALRAWLRCCPGRWLFH